MKHLLEQDMALVSFYLISRGFHACFFSSKCTKSSYDSYRKNGIPKAMHQFASMIVGKEDHQVIEYSMRQHENEYAMANAAYWIEHEVRQYPRVQLDLAALAKHTRQIVLIGGWDAQDKVSYQSNKVLARQLGLNLIDFPGEHLGFITSPAEFAKELMDVIKDN